MNLLDAIDLWVLSNKVSRASRQKMTFYPTEASCVDTTTGKVVGTCLRKAYWGHIKKPSSRIEEAGKTWILDMGNAVEDVVMDKLTAMNILIQRNVHFYLPDENISGEADALIWDFDLDPKTKVSIIKEPRQIVGVEVKSAYSKAFFFGIQKEPKIEHILQVMLYLYYWTEVPYFNIMYIARDNPRENRVVHQMWLKNRNTPVINGKEMTSITIQGILKRFQKLDKCIKEGIVPDREFKWNYTAKEIEANYLKGEVSKTKYNNWKKGKATISDWQCQYCKYLDDCYPERVNPTEDTYDVIGKEKPKDVEVGTINLEKGVK